MKNLFLILLFLGKLFASHELSICAIFKNEAPYLKEWIEFHKMQGVNHFYLYNNNSTDNFQEVLDPYIALKEVTLTDWAKDYEPIEDYGLITVPWTVIQRDSYTHCIHTYGKNTKWLAVIDLDEFLFCPDGQPLPSFLKNYKQYAGLCVNWLLFGTSNYEELPKGKLQIEALTKCVNKSHPRNKMVKSIVQPKFVVKAIDPHIFCFKNPYFAVTEKFEKLEEGRRATHVLRIDKIRINHYWTRTEKYFREKKVPSRMARRVYKSDQAIYDMKKGFNEQEDLMIQRFVPMLKQRLNY